MKLAKERLFADLGYEPHEGQWLVHNSQAKRRVLACGSRWGKTYCAAMEGIAAALEPRAESRGWVVAPTFDLASRVFRRMQVVVLEKLQHRVIEMHERERWFTLHNIAGGVSEVRAKSCDRPVSLLGEALDWMVVDEAALISEDTWESFLSPRLLDRDGWALLLSTPRGAGWFYRAFRAGIKRKKPGFEAWSAPSWENPHLSPELIELERGRIGEDAFRQEWAGEFINVEMESCDTCGFPALDVPGVLIVRNKEKLHYCRECNNIITLPSGRTAVRRVPGQEPQLSVIRLFPNPRPEPDLPEEVLQIISQKDRNDHREPFGIENWQEQPEEEETSRKPITWEEVNELLEEELGPGTRAYRVEDLWEGIYPTFDPE